MMTTLFRIVLIIASIGTFAVIVQKVRRSKMRIEDSIFWVILCLMFVVFAIFPGVADGLSHMLGIYSTANFLFLFTIFILIMKLFSMSLNISVLETKLKELSQQKALSEKENAEKLIGEKKARKVFPSETGDSGDRPSRGKAAEILSEGISDKRSKKPENAEITVDKNYTGNPEDRGNKPDKVNEINEETGKAEGAAHEVR